MKSSVSIKRHLLLTGVLLFLAGCNPRGPVTVAGPSGKMTVVVKQDYASLSTSQRLTSDAIEAFIADNGRLPSKIELAAAPVLWNEKEYALAEVVDILSVSVTAAPVGNAKKLPPATPAGDEKQP